MLKEIDRTIRETEARRDAFGAARYDRTTDRDSRIDAIGRWSELDAMVHELGMLRIRCGAAG